MSASSWRHLEAHLFMGRWRQKVAAHLDWLTRRAIEGGRKRNFASMLHVIGRLPNRLTRRLSSLAVTLCLFSSLGTKPRLAGVKYREDQTMDGPRPC
ncbi:hypothetical protein B0I35DRAFT_417213 [Stachybotrys elegans]|uniref:Uncharacterized protein n=1 Tax=Stachybotrys elegans TaxID=80388 RepID=A0A8K0T0M4_9HYPO|nr:hypothetical protein B0I35DRAFT_417213 [Stachybotrys elegans]